MQPINIGNVLSSISTQYNIDLHDMVNIKWVDLTNMETQDYHIDRLVYATKMIAVPKNNFHRRRASGHEGEGTDHDI